MAQLFLRLISWIGPSTQIEIHICCHRQNQNNTSLQSHSLYAQQKTTETIKNKTTNIHKLGLNSQTRMCNYLDTLSLNAGICWTELDKLLSHIIGSSSFIKAKFNDLHWQFHVWSYLAKMQNALKVKSYNITRRVVKNVNNANFVFWKLQDILCQMGTQYTTHTPTRPPSIGSNNSQDEVF